MDATPDLLGRLLDLDTGRWSEPQNAVDSMPSFAAYNPLLTGTATDKQRPLRDGIVRALFVDSRAQRLTRSTSSVHVVTRSYLINTLAVTLCADGPLTVHSMVVMT
jgi:hypothetical protein